MQLYLVSRLRSWWLELLTLRLDTSVNDPVASKEKQMDLEAKLSRGKKSFADRVNGFFLREYLISVYQPF